MAIAAERAKAHGIALGPSAAPGISGGSATGPSSCAADGLVSLHFLNTTGLGMMAVPFGGTDRRLSLCPLAICVRRGRAARRSSSTSPPRWSPKASSRWRATRARGRPRHHRRQTRAGRPPTPATSMPAARSSPSPGTRARAERGDRPPGGRALGRRLHPPGGQAAGQYHDDHRDRPRPPGRPHRADCRGGALQRLGEGLAAEQPGGEVLLPGEVEHRTREQRRRDGLPVDDATLDQILDAGEAVGLDRAAMPASSRRKKCPPRCPSYGRPEGRDQIEPSAAAAYCSMDGRSRPPSARSRSHSRKEQ